MPTPRRAPRPNVLLLHCHDLGRHLGCYGADTVSSPNLDGLAADGVLAERMFAAAPQCSPSRASLMTGRWPQSNGVLGLTHLSAGWDLNPGERHLARRLKHAGYATELVGVHHESKHSSDAETAAAHGFDLVVTGGLVDDVVDRGCDAIRRRVAAPEPFFLQVGFIEPHRIPGARDVPGVMGFIGDHLEPDTDRGVAVPPYLADTPSAREEIAELQGGIKAMDAGVGRILGALEESGASDNTIVVFTTDHGVALPGAKCSLSDAGLEVAYLMRWPAGGLTGGMRVNELLSNIDVVPTLLDLLELAADDGEPLHGQTFAPLLTNTAQARPRDVIFGELTYHDYYDPRRCVRTGRHKLIVNFSSAPVFMDPSQSWNRRCVPVNAVNGNVGSHPAIELYDLESDPLEQQNLADRPALAGLQSELMTLLHDWMAATDDPLLTGAVTSPHHRTMIGALHD